MKSILTKIVLTASLLLCSVTGYAQDDTAKEAIENRLAEMTEAFKAKDVEGFASCWTEDALLKFSGKPALKGRATIVDVHKPMMEQDMSIKTETREVFQQGDFATEIGSYEILIADGTVVESGLYSTLWKKTDGKWRIMRDVISAVEPAEESK
ncbi:YybH family protein [Robertkochia flava]|uniref:YybH family protein n=1 Tax=Robertkochia flava TaxID=3447986 RepID=UPI001CD01502|nr:nuclear transport factor 2 family protein [Robertkochia marina]